MAEVRLLVVRVWRRNGEFRASVRAADEDEPQSFDSPEQVAEYLGRLVVADAAAQDE